MFTKARIILPNCILEAEFFDTPCAAAVIASLPITARPEIPVLSPPTRCVEKSIQEDIKMEDINQELEKIKLRLDKLESQVIFLSRRMGIDVQETPKWNISEKLSMLIRQGKEIEAIREFVNETGASLKDAKLFIENAMKQMK